MKEVTLNEEKVIFDHVFWAVTAGLVPMPILDILSVSTVQTAMIKQLCALYGKDFSKIKAKAWITGLTGSGLARLGASLIKIIPGVGTVVGEVSMAVLSGATTYAIGRAMAKHFADGGSLEDFRFDKLKAIYTSSLEEGKKIASRFKEKAASRSKKKINARIAKQLKDLERMKQNGILTDEEFVQIKEKLINEFLGGKAPDSDGDDAQDVQ